VLATSSTLRPIQDSNVVLIEIHIAGRPLGEIDNESPCLGGNKCLEGFEGMSCSRCKKGYYRFQRTCVECKGENTETSLAWAYFFLLVAFYLAGRCRLTVSKPVLKAPLVSALETEM
jgi:hypothetical protein